MRKKSRSKAGDAKAPADGGAVMGSSPKHAEGRRPGLAELRALVHQQVAMSGDRAFESPPRGDRRPPRMMTEIERHGVSPTDHDARSPLGVGTSTSARAERIAQREEEAGRGRHGTEGPSERPYGTSTDEDITGVGASRGSRPGDRSR